MFIQTETTPNPSTLKFKPGKVVYPGGSLQVNTQKEAMHTPIAKELFDIDGINAVFFGEDFISVTKVKDIAWEIIQPDI